MLKRKRQYKKQQPQKKEKKKTLEEIRVEKEILSSISSPNPWTPEAEDKWLKQPSRLLKTRFPPIKKPPHVSKQGKRYG
jgi:hypothetical protein